MRKISIYTDGSCKFNPGPGGYSVIVVENEALVREIGGSKLHTTNNEMELEGVYMAIRYCINMYLQLPVEVTIFTDSTYVEKGLNEWRHKWEANNYKSANGKTIANLDVWKRLIREFKRAAYFVSIRHVKGHNGNKWNEFADKVAVGYSKKAAETLNETFKETIKINLKKTKV